MMVFLSSRSRSATLLFFCLLFFTGCGPKDYQKPIQDFADASAVVAASASSYLNHWNVLEQNTALRRLAFEGKPIDLEEISKMQVVSPEELALRSQAITVLAQYTTHLAVLASGAAGSATAANFKDLESTLQKVATDAGALTGHELNNTKFSGIASAAASAIGAVAQLVIDHKARKDIEASVIAHEGDINALIDLIGDEMQMAYQRQKASVGASRIYLTKAYGQAIALPGPAGAPASTISDRLSLADNLAEYRRQEALLAAADPQPAVLDMKAAFGALVQYARNDHDPGSAATLWQRVQDFVAAAQPLGQAIHDLASAIV